MSGIHGELRKHLAQNQGKVLDLFRAWDKDGDGSVSYPEFIKFVRYGDFEPPKRRRKSIAENFRAFTSRFSKKKKGKNNITKTSRNGGA